MIGFALLSLAAALAAPANAGHPAAQASAAKETQATDAPPQKLKSLLQSCDAHKFETTVESVVDGKPNRSKVKMCGQEGQTESEWIESLRDAIAKLEANDSMPRATRDQIIHAIKAEIARLEMEQEPAGPRQGAQAAASGVSELPRGRSAVPAREPLSDDYSVLPPLSAAPPPPPSLLGPPPASEQLATRGPAAASAEKGRGSAVPKSPPAPVAAQAVQPMPRLDFSCVSPEYPAGGPCVTLSRDTILTIRPADALAAGVTLRFIRSGTDRAEIPLGAVGKRRSVRLALPAALCSGVSSAEAQIAIVRGGQVLDRRGPYLLRC